MFYGSVGRKHRLHHEAMLVLLVWIVVERLQHHWKQRDGVGNTATPPSDCHPTRGRGAKEGGGWRPRECRGDWCRPTAPDRFLYITITITVQLMSLFVPGSMIAVFWRKRFSKRTVNDVSGARLNHTGVRADAVAFWRRCFHLEADALWRRVRQLQLCRHYISERPWKCTYIVQSVVCNYDFRSQHQKGHRPISLTLTA